MPFVIYVFSLCAFAIGFTEFITIGLISVMSVNLGADVTSIGLTVTAYALGIVIGAPILTALASNWSRKRLLLTAMLVFTLGNLLAAASANLALLLAARLLSGLAHGVFFAVASGVATRLVPSERAGTALALVFGGVTIAMSLGVPAGTWLGSILDWRVIFLIISACGLLGTLGIGFKMPKDAGEQIVKTSASWRHLTILFDRRLLAGASVPMLSYTASFALYTFITPILLSITGVSVETASGVLLAYGIGAAVGTVWGGRLTDRQGMDLASLILLVGIAVVLAAMSFSLTHSLLMIGLTALLGLATYGAIPPLQSRILMLAKRHTPYAMDIASGMNIAAFNAGVVLGSVIGGATVREWGLETLTWVGAVTGVLAIVSLVWQMVIPSMREQRSIPESR
ncbi:MFS transporter [Xenorhabdus bovienii]|uniref:MFS transporter n=1 Tax=Xenorhabdus bovienii TaxID=40576 RepID=UPI0004D68EDB|nr:MFS transporter [Xenorhabdus bovienii]CDG87516.1 Major facilitator superfamily [Xenorhabdus bovienii str. feltiae France]CDG94112.1 Major facilitator superfamily [Xenorhabdus bovienii str. feltiae Florida]